MPSTLYSICTVPARSKMSVPLTRSPLVRGMFEVDKHDVRAAGLEVNCLAGIDFCVFEFSHFCDTIFYCHGMKFKTTRGV